MKGHVLLMSLLSWMAVAPPVQAMEEKDNPVQKAVVSVRRELASQNQEYQNLLKSLYQINKEVKRYVEERSALDQDRILTEAQIKSIQDKILKLEGQLKTQQGQLLAKFRFMNKFNAEAWFEFLMKAENSAQLERNMKILSLLGKRDIQALKDYAKLMRDLKRQRQTHESRMAYVADLQKKISVMENSLRDQTELRNKLLEGIREKQKHTLAKLRRLQDKNAGSLLHEAGILDALLKNSFADRKGSLEHPVVGSLTQNYGVIRDNENHLVLSHRGWMYSAPAESPVRTVFEGQVAHIGYFPEYGNYAIIDHGDHFYSVYAMLSKIKLKVGDKVIEGQDFASVGINPFDGRSGLYLEIRHFAETLDPKPWMKGKIYEISQVTDQE